MKTNDHVYAVVLAGGSGTRFWPKSRTTSPKQLCNIGSAEQTMIQKTLSRLDGFIPPERRIIVTHEQQLASTKEIVREQCQHFLAEPQARNTAAALALAAFEIDHICSHPEPVMVSLHADHIIEDEQKFKQDLSRGIAVAEAGYLTLLGIEPRYAETGYGYIEVGKPLAGDPILEAYSVASFREKPALALAEEYVKKGTFLWNSGYFIWRTNILLNEIKEFLPTTHKRLFNLSRGSATSFNNIPPEDLSETYEQLEKIAIDNAVLERSSNVAVIRTNFGWYDVGSWDALLKCFPVTVEGNFVTGDVHIIDTEGSVIESDGPFVAAIGVKDLVIVAAKGAVLVCPKNRAQEVKKVVEYLTENRRHELT